MRRLWVLGLLAASSLLGQADLDTVVQRALKEFQVPGMAVGVIQDGKVILAKGYGVRKLGEPAPVTDKTLFGIASNTKAFTAAALAILVDEKKLEWDQRVVDVLPGFEMSDPYVTREMRVRDLLVHRSGLPLGAGDLMYWPESNLTPKEVLFRLRYVPLTASFRSRYAYDNILYIVAGAVIEQVSGKPWAQFVRERIFQPLGMAASRTSIHDVQPGEDLAWPHAPVGEKVAVAVHDKSSAWAPAAAIQSSVSDLLKWVNAQLHEGEYPGGRLFSAAQSREMWTPQIFIPINPKLADELSATRPHFQAYALGWMTADYRGQKLVWHTGGLLGMVTRVTLVPEKKLGIIVLTNQQETGAFQAVTMTILDHYLGGAPATDWVNAYGTVRKRQLDEASEKVKKSTSARDAASKPSLPLAKYVGRYRDAWYGDIAIAEANGKLTMRFSHTPALTGTLEHFQYDTFIVRWTDRSLDADAYVTFALKPDGAISEVKMQAVSATTDFSFDFHDLALKPVGADVAGY